MKLQINDDSITSDHSAHTARLLPGDGHVWEVSWLPGRPMDRNSAITAMVIAEAVGSGDLHPGQRLWPHLEGWTGELGLTTRDVIAWAAHPSGSIAKDGAAEPDDPEAAGA